MLGSSWSPWASVIAVVIAAITALLLADMATAQGRLRRKLATEVSIYDKMPPSRVRDELGRSVCYGAVVRLVRTDAVIASAIRRSRGVVLATVILDIALLVTTLIDPSPIWPLNLSPWIFFYSALTLTLALAVTSWVGNRLEVGREVARRVAQGGALVAEQRPSGSRNGMSAAQRIWA